MKIIIEEFKIRYGENSIEKAIANRREEMFIFEYALRKIRKYLEKVANGGRKPFIIWHGNEGATSLSLLAEWAPPVEELVRQHGGTLIITFNTGVNIGKIPDEEFKRRLDVIETILNSIRSPKILTNNVLRTVNRRRDGKHDISELVFDNDLFDYFYTLALYSMVIAISAEPLEADLENILLPESIHAITTPCLVGGYDDFVREKRSRGISFMAMSDLGAGYHAPFVDDVVGRIDGVVLVGYSPERVKAFTEALRKIYPQFLYSTYAVKSVREERSLIRRIIGRTVLPIVQETSPSRSWNVELASLFFLAKLSTDEAIRSIIEIRDVLRRTSIKPSKGS